jgi:hypothetical protein
LTRFRILALLVACFATASLLAACGGSDDGGSGEDPQKVLENAGLAGVTSGNIDLSLQVNAEGDEGGDVEVKLSGPFEAGAKGELPQFDMTAEASGTSDGEDLDFEGGLTVLTDRAFIDYKGTNYEIDPTTFSFVKSAVEQAQQQEGSESGDITACQKAAEGIKFSQFADELVNEGSADVDGTSTTKVSGDVDVDGGIDALIQLTENPACKSQLEAAGPLPIGELEDAKGELSKSVKKAHIDLYVGDDDIVRKVAAELTIQPPGSAKEKVGRELGKTEVDLELTLAGVNEEQTFTTPSSTKPLEGLFQEVGINPLEIGELLEGGLGGLLDGVGGSSGGSGSGGSGGYGSPGGGSAQKKYTECLQGAETPADLQKCASLLK